MVLSAQLAVDAESLPRWRRHRGSPGSLEQGRLAGGQRLSLHPRHEKEVAQLVPGALDGLELRRLHELVVARGDFHPLANATEQLGAGKNALIVFQLVEERAGK